VTDLWRIRLAVASTNHYKPNIGIHHLHRTPPPGNAAAETWQAIYHYKYSFLHKSGCIQNTESGFPRLSRTISATFHIFPGPFNRVDIEHVRFWYTCTKSITLCTQFKRGIQPKCGVKTEKRGVQNWKMWSPQFRKTRTWVRNVATIWFIFHDFPGLENLNFKFHDFPGSVRTLTNTDNNKAWTPRPEKMKNSAQNKKTKAWRDSRKEDYIKVHRLQYSKRQSTASDSIYHTTRSESYQDIKANI